MKTIKNRKSIALGLTVGLLLSIPSEALRAQTIFWSGNATGWDNTISWSTSSSAPTPNPATVPGAANLASFSISTVNSAQTVNLNADRSVIGLSFLGTNTATTTLQGGGANRTLTLGLSGILVNTSAGAVTIGSSTSGQNVNVVLGPGHQAWTNNSSNTLTIQNGVSRSPGSTLNIAGTNSTPVTAVNSLGNTSAGIVGTWASFGSGSNTAYATKNVSNQIVALTGTAAANAGNLTDTTGLINYDLAAATGSLPATVSANTIRYTGSAGTTSLGASSFTVNGLMNSSSASGTWTLSNGTITIGSDQELVVNATRAITISSSIQNSLGGASAVTKTGGNTLLLSGNNSYTGMTYVNQGALNVQSNTALGSSSNGTVVTRGAVLELQNNVTITGEELNLSGAGLSDLGALRNVSGNNTWTGNITLGAASTRISSSSGLLTISGNIANSSFQTLFLGAGEIVVSGAINGTGGVATSSLFTGNLTLSGSSNFTGATEINNGVVLANSIKDYSTNSSLGAATTGDIVIGQASNTGTLVYTGAGDSSNRRIRIGTNSSTPTATDTGGASIINNGTGALVFSNTSFNSALNASSGVGANRVLTLGGSNAGNNQISGAIIDNTKSGSATGDTRIGVTKTGLGTWILAGNNTYSGATLVSAGTLLVNNSEGSGLGSGTVTVASGAILGGTGSFSGAATVNGTFSPGASIQTLGSGALILNNNSTFEYEVNSSVASGIAADLAKVSGSLTLNGTVQLTLSDLALSPSAFTLGTTFSLINYTGSWNGGLFTYSSSVLNNGDQFTAGLNTWQIAYDATSGGVNFSGEYVSGNFVNITSVVPEPSTSLLLTLSLGALALVVRRRSASASSRKFEQERQRVNA